MIMQQSFLTVNHVQKLELHFYFSDILKNGGNSVDAAIGTLLCDSVVCPDLTGIGGGFLMTIYNRTTNTSIFINARETAPGAANYTMYDSDPTKSLTGALAIAVPGMIRGVWASYNLYGGGVSWASLIKPTIQLCEEGIVVSKRLGANINAARDLILKTGLKKYFVNNRTGDLMQPGDIYTLSKLGQTLRVIANEGANSLYDGSLTPELIYDIQSAGGIITKEDFSNYTVLVEESFEINLKSGYKIYSGLPVGSGIILAYILRTLDGLLPTPNVELDAVRLVEAFKFAYGERSHLGDHIFVDTSEILKKVTSDMYMSSVQNNMSDQHTSTDPKFYGAEFSWSEDHGTENIAVLDSFGNAVAVTSTINTPFGSGFVSESTGIIFNNQMNDFSTPGFSNFYGYPSSLSNLIQPHKRPMSSMCPTIITDFKGDVVLVIGGAGGPKIPLATAYVSALVLWYNKTLKEAIEEPRLYHQLIPMRVDYEYGVLKPVVEKLKHVGHKMKRIMIKDKSAVTGIFKTPKGITAMSDFRQIGNVSGY
ncbi:glutathione hydrolase 1 proenzyme-like isoform X2 [Rhopalosiphum maidis]|uniref:glutathione hydrolase 1 proenzyme-like isoform X2 n=1 Tax=Rhopalosiphum maidis TaxID=43146 RepID=UPI000EFFF538|nr:glutathione hydrolase 1 proenzyme-like isoform X2 [Rhopalosiphum maidis]